MSYREASLPDLIPNAPRHISQDPLDVRLVSRPFTGVPENNRGQSVIMNPGQTNVPIIETKHGGPDGEMMTLALGFEVVNPTVTTPTVNEFDVTAQVQWGIGGATLTAIVDVQRGCFLRIPAQTIRVTADYRNPGTTPSQIRMTAMVGYGNQSTRSSNARFTQDLGPIAPAGVSTVRAAAIPFFASSFTVVAKSTAGLFLPAPIPATVVLGDGAVAGTRVTYNISDLTTPSPENTIVIPNGFTFLQVQNNSGSTFSPLIVYSLTL